MGFSTNSFYKRNVGLQVDGKIFQMGICITMESIRKKGWDYHRLAEW